MYETEQEIEKVILVAVFLILIRTRRNHWMNWRKLF